MTVQDISNILTVMEEMSINKAAAKLFISQPALSKCIRKVEQEYNIALFQRTKGSSLVLTEAGIRFREMGSEVMKTHRLFTYQIEQLKTRNRSNIVFATTMQRAYDMSGPIMKWIYERYPGYNMELKTMSSREIVPAIFSGDVDIALLPDPEENPKLFISLITESSTCLYLREGCPAASFAQHIDGLPYPVLSLRHLKGERFVENKAGTGGRRSTELILRKAGLNPPLVEQPVYSLRLTMVNAGQANMLIRGDAILRQTPGFAPERIFCLPPEEDMVSRTCLVCRKEFRGDKRYRIMEEAITEYYKSL